MINRQKTTNLSRTDFIKHLKESIAERKRVEEEEKILTSLNSKDSRMSKTKEEYDIDQYHSSDSSEDNTQNSNILV